MPLSMTQVTQPCDEPTSQKDASGPEFSVKPASHPPFNTTLVSVSPSHDVPVGVMAQRFRIALEHPHGHAKGMVDALQALEEWLRDVHGARAAAAAAGIAPAIVSIMRLYGDEAGVCKHACAALAEAAHGDMAGVTALADAGAVSEVCAFLARDTGNLDVQLHGIASLALLAQRRSAAQQATAAGGVHLTHQAVESHGESNAAVAAASCWALRRLAERGNAPRQGMRTAAQRMKLAHLADPVVGHAAESLLQFLHSCDGDGSIPAPPEDVRTWPYRQKCAAFGDQPFLTSADRAAAQKPCV